MSDVTDTLQRHSDGKFSTGGTSPSFTERGKAWGNIGALKNHLNLFLVNDPAFKKDEFGRTIGRHDRYYAHPDYPYDGCELRTYRSYLADYEDMESVTNELIEARNS